MKSVKWIDDDPLESEVEQNSDGSEFIPIGLVEKKLTRLDTHWGTENFKFALRIGNSGLMFASGSLELVVTYGGKTRKLVGATTMLVPADTDFDNPDVNSNFEAVIKSENIKNAAKGLGKNFGSGLNGRDVIATPTIKTPMKAKSKPPAVKMKPDARIQAQYNAAFLRCDDKMMDVLNQIYEIIYTAENA